MDKKFNVIINNYMDTDHGTIIINSTMIAEGISEQNAFNMLQVIKSDFDRRRPEKVTWYTVDEAACGSGNLYFVSRNWVQYNCHFNEVATMHEAQ